MIAGLVCNNGEFFTHDHENHLVFDGQRVPYAEFPIEVLQVIDNSIEPAHQKALDTMDIRDIDSRRNKWLSCNQANLDFVADYNPNKSKLEREVVQCGQRSSCDQNGILCLSPSQASGLTNRRLQVLKCIGKGMLDKEIAVKLKISEKTVRAHNKYLREFTGCHRKADLALYAKKINLI